MCFLWEKIKRILQKSQNPAKADFFSSDYCADSNAGHRSVFLHKSV